MIVKPLPKWAMQKYAILWNRFKTQEFNHESASKILKEKNPNLVSVLLNHLKKNGWLIVKLDLNDTRKRVYVLISLEKAVEEISKSLK